MSNTIDILSRMELYVDGKLEGTPEQHTTGDAWTQMVRQRVILSESTANYQVSLGSNFTTPVWGLVKGTGGTFTYSRSGPGSPHLVNSGGFAAWEGNSTSIYLSNNSDADTPTIDVILVGD